MLPLTPKILIVHHDFPYEPSLCAQLSARGIPFLSLHLSTVIDYTQIDVGLQETMWRIGGYNIDGRCLRSVFFDGHRIGAYLHDSKKQDAQDLDYLICAWLALFESMFSSIHCIQPVSPFLWDASSLQINALYHHARSYDIATPELFYTEVPREPTFAVAQLYEIYLQYHYPPLAGNLYLYDAQGQWLRVVVIGEHILLECNPCVKQLPETVTQQLLALTRHYHLAVAQYWLKVEGAQTTLYDMTPYPQWSLFAEHSSCKLLAEVLIQYQGG